MEIVRLGTDKAKQLVEDAEKKAQNQADTLLLEFEALKTEMAQQFKKDIDTKIKRLQKAYDKQINRVVENLLNRIIGDNES